MAGGTSGKGRIYRSFLAALLCLSAGLALLPGRPAQALGISLPGFPANAIAGTPLGFTVLVNVNPGEFLPLQNINLYIFKSDNRPGYQATCLGLPLTAGNRIFSEAQTGGGSVTLFANVDGGWNYRTNLGYGPGPASIKYEIIWQAPQDWPVGTYQAEVRLTVKDTLVLNPVEKLYYQSASFYLDMRAPLGSTLVSRYINGAGYFAGAVTAASASGWAKVSISAGVKATVSRQPIAEINILPMNLPPPPTANTTIIDQTYNFGPEGALFEPSVSVSIKYDPAKLPPGVNEKNLYMANWNNLSGRWDILPSSVDPAAHTVTAPTSHFSIFAVMASTLPATFALSNLSISPAPAVAGSPVTISVTVANTGDLSGMATVNLTIDGVPAGNKEVLVPGKSSQKVTFSVSIGTPGDYVVGVNGLTGTLSVKPAPVPTTRPPLSTLTPTPTPSSTSASPPISSSPAAQPSVTPKTATTAPSVSPTRSPATSTPTPAPYLPPQLMATDWTPFLLLLAIIAMFVIGLWLIISYIRNR